MTRSWKKEGRDGLKPGDVATRPLVYRGDPRALIIGRTIGVLIIKGGQVPVYSIGQVQVGPQRYTGGVSPGRDDIFLSRNGRVWRLAEFRLLGPAPARPPGKYRTATRDAFHLWADACAAMLVDALVPSPNIELVDQVNSAYRQRVGELVTRACEKAREHDLERSPTSYAQGICRDWIDIDLTDMRVPTVQHALYTSLVLALEPPEATELICMAALMEYQAPLMDEQVARVLYQQAVRLLAQVCPAWWSAGPLLDWTQHGSIDLLFRNQWSRMLALAQEREVSIAAVAGFHWKGRRGIRTSPPEGFPQENQGVAEDG